MLNVGKIIFNYVAYFKAPSSSPTIFGFMFILLKKLTNFKCLNEIQFLYHFFAGDQKDKSTTFFLLLVRVTGMRKTKLRSSNRKNNTVVC